MKRKKLAFYMLAIILLFLLGCLLTEKEQANHAISEEQLNGLNSISAPQHDEENSLLQIPDCTTLRVIVLSSPNRALTISNFSLKYLNSNPNIFAIHDDSDQPLAFVNRIAYQAPLAFSIAPITDLDYDIYLSSGYTYRLTKGVERSDFPIYIDSSNEPTSDEQATWIRSVFQGSYSTFDTKPMKGKITSNGLDISKHPRYNRVCGSTGNETVWKRDFDYNVNQLFVEGRYIFIVSWLPSGGGFTRNLRITALNEEGSVLWVKDFGEAYNGEVDLGHSHLLGNKQSYVVVMWNKKTEDGSKKYIEAVTDLGEVVWDKRLDYDVEGIERDQDYADCLVVVENYVVVYRYDGTFELLSTREGAVVNTITAEKSTIKSCGEIKFEGNAKGCFFLLESGDIFFANTTTQKSVLVKVYRKDSVGDVSVRCEKGYIVVTRGIGQVDIIEGSRLEWISFEKRVQ